MGNDTQRDRAIERMLEQRQAAQGPPDAIACVDGETLAAWTAGTLRAAEAARVEEHLADCDRCQTMLAAFARTEPVTPARPVWWQRWQVRWLVPLATAATVAAIWVTVPERAPDTVALSTRNDLQFKSEPQLQQAPTPSAATPPPTAIPAPAPRQEPAGQRFVEPSDAGNRAKTEAPAPASPPPPATALEAREEAPPRRSLQESVIITTDSAAAARLGGAVVEIRSPDESVRWRVIRGGIERSTDGGARWEPLVLPSPATLLSGHSPAPSVAWFVGRSGAVFITTDGSRLDRLVFAEPLDLIAVVASNEREATITAATGQRFITTDRGVTWTRR